jgi:hypothetical protein
MNITEDYKAESENLEFYENKQLIFTKERYERLFRRIDDYHSRDIPYILREQLFKRLEILKNSIDQF